MKDKKCKSLMDASEVVVEKLLTHMGFQSVVYEPDGNIPPDFLADGRVAVEVRRLNQNHDSGNGKRGLEETSIPLWRKIETLGHSLGPAKNESWFLFFRFSRPVKPWKELKTELHAALVAFMAQPTRHNGRLYTDESFELDVIRSSHPLEHYFRMGSSRDRQAGGMIIAEMLANIAYCADEKLQKIANVRSKYPEWWLVLTDYIGLVLNSHDKQQLLALAERPVGWDKIVVVSPIDATKWLQF
jgi:hypothetical protein